MIKLLVAALVVYALYVFLKPQPRRMPADEARAVLGVGADANADEIRAAHRRLVAAVHPDRGGSAELTRRVNAARDALLK
jgi:CysZ protein